MRKLLLICSLLLAGCATPGSTVTVIGYNPSSVVYEYTRWYASELQAAMNSAQQYCQQFGKNAQVGATVPAGPNPIDRVMTTFYCV